jgi:two-component system phosphate regulon response regulator PhoB
MSPLILVVEDVEELRLLAMLTLAPLGRIDCASGIAGALELIGRERPDVLVLDIVLGFQENGLDLCRMLKASPTTSPIRIVLVSAQGQQGDIEAGLACGADRYVVKPFSPEQLFATVADLLER